MRHLGLLLFLSLSVSTLWGSDSYFFGPLENSNSFEELRDFIEKKNIQNPNELLAEFSKDSAWKRYLEFFVLLYSSSSAQRADVTATHPRIISHYGRMVLGLTGKPPEEGGRHYNRIEIMEFVPSSATFQFRVIDFSRKGKERFLTNPTNCRGCHGTPSRPIWSTYPLWPKTYGGNDDTLTPGKETKEVEYWETFFRKNRKAERYSYLDFGEEYNFDRAAPRYDLKSSARYTPSMPLRSRNSLRLNSHLTKMNQLRIDREVSQFASWNSYKFAIAGALLNCSSIEEFLPSELLRKHESNLNKDLPQLKKYLIQEIERNMERKEILFRALSGSKEMLRPSFDLGFDPFGLNSMVLFKIDHLDLLTNLSFILEGADNSEIAVRKWGMDYDPLVGSESYVLDQVSQGFTTDWPTVNARIQADDEFEGIDENYPKFPPILTSDQKKICAVLKVRSAYGLGR